jgi:hypothetical protein
MRSFTRWALAGALTLAMAAGATPAVADVDAGTGEIEIYAGWLWPDEESGTDLDDLTYGLRLGYNVTEHFGIVGTLGYWQAEDTVASGLFEQDTDGLFFDVSFEWIVNPDSEAVFIVYGGPGYAAFNADYRDKLGTGLDFSVDDDVFTVHAGMTARFQVMENFFIRPDLRVRWSDSDLRSDDAYDWEATLGVGWYLGR